MKSYKAEFKKGDQLYTRVEYTIVDGAYNNLVNNDTVPQSDIHTIESSGVMRVNVNGQWHEGQVWINVGGQWKEATDVYVNVEGKWKESI